MGRKWGGSERAEASVELWTQGALRHKKHSPYGTLRTPRCAQRTLNFVKAFIKLKRIGHMTLFSCLRKEISFFFYFWQTIFLQTFQSLFCHSKDFYRRFPGQ